MDAPYQGGPDVHVLKRRPHTARVRVIWKLGTGLLRPLVGERDTFPVLPSRRSGAASPQEVDLRSGRLRYSTMDSTSESAGHPRSPVRRSQR